MRSYVPNKATLVPKHAKRVFEGIIFDVYQWPQEMFDGTTRTFEMIKRPDTVEIIAINEGKVVLSKEEQPHAGSFITLPAGMHEHDHEDELAAAKRELREETGYTFKNWKLIHTVQHSNKMEQIIYYFLATEPISIEEQYLDDDGEKINTIEIPFAEYIEMNVHPNMKFYPAELMNKINSLDEILALPSLHDYENKN